MPCFVMMEPKDKTDKTFILEFKVYDPDLDEKTLEDTAQAALRQIEDKGYTAVKDELISRFSANHL